MSLPGHLVLLVAFPPHLEEGQAPRNSALLVHSGSCFIRGRSGPWTWWKNSCAERGNWLFPGHLDEHVSLGLLGRTRDVTAEAGLRVRLLKGVVALNGITDGQCRP